MSNFETFSKRGGVVFFRTFLVAIFVALTVATIADVDPDKLYVVPFTRKRITLGPDGVVLYRLVAMGFTIYLLQHIRKLVSGVREGWAIRFCDQTIEIPKLNRIEEILWSDVERIKVKMHKNKKYSEVSELIFSLKNGRSVAAFVICSTMKKADAVRAFEKYRPDIKPDYC